jgi:hypothetical protein
MIREQENKCGEIGRVEHAKTRARRRVRREMQSGALREKRGKECGVKGRRKLKQERGNECEEMGRVEQAKRRAKKRMRRDGQSGAS